MVITVIIIIILSTVAINVLFGEDGILNIAQNAKRETEIENIREKLEMAKGVAAIDGHGKIDPDHYFDILEEEGIIWDKEKDVEEKGDGIYNVTTKEGYVFEVILGEDGDITIDYIGKENVTGPRIREIRVIETSSNSVRIEVVADNVEGATYTYSAKELPNGEWQEKGTSSDNIYTIEGLTSEKAYTIKVKVETNKGSDEEEIGVTIGDLPTGIITFGDTTWTNEQASVTISTESSYRLQYQIDGIEENNWTEIQSEEAVTGLSLGQTLYARLWDGTNGGEHASVDIEDKTAPTVTVNRGTVTSNSIGVNVTAVDNESGMKESLTYTYYIKQTNQADSSYTAEATDITSSSYTFSGLTQGTSYDIKVEVKADKAENAGTGTLLNTTTGTVTSGLEEGAITFGDTTWTNEQASVTISTESSYTIQYQINGIDEGNWTEIANEGTVSGLNLNDTLYARLWDGTNGGEHASVDIEDKIPPTVEIQTSNLTHNSVTLTVTASDNESGLAETNRYTYYLNNVQQASNNTASYNYTGLNPETSYELKVVVKDKAGLTTEKATTITTEQDPNAVPSILREGDYVEYVDGTGVTRECVVLYGPENVNYEDYGIQIITMESVENVTLGSLNFSFSTAMNQYNDVINILNNATSKYLNPTYAESVRCVGSVANEPSYDGAGMHTTQFGGSYSGRLKDTDENYLTDWKQMNSLTIYDIDDTYWLASRRVNSYSSHSYFDVRIVYPSGALGLDSLCRVNSSGRTYVYSNTNGLRPCFTLKSDIKVTGGSGEEGNAYTLGV